MSEQDKRQRAAYLDTQNVLLHEIPASIDGDPAHDAMLSELLQQMFGERAKIHDRSGALFAEWCELPNVTMDQACWLLLERTPWNPLPGRKVKGTLREQFERTRNRLECEVGRSLQPIRPYNLPTVQLRFYLADVVRVADAVRLQPVVASVIREYVGRAKQPQRSMDTPQRRRVDERMSFHRTVVDVLLSKKPPQAISSPPKEKTNKRRKYTGAPANVEIVDMTQVQYCALYRELFVGTHGHNRWGTADAQLIDDCRALNIAFAAHRPKGSPDKKPRHRRSR